MRLKRNRLKQYHHRQAVPKKNNEGTSYTDYGVAVPFMAEMWPGGGKVQAETYGLRLPNIRNLRIDGGYKEVYGVNEMLSYQIDDGPLIKAGDGICLYAGPEEEPDYKIAAVYPNRYLTLEVEKT